MSPLKPETDLKLYRSISDVSEMIGVKPHVLRYWETQFSMLRPKKNRAGNRMYRPEEVKLLLRIKELLYARRFTIEGAKKRLAEERRETPQVEIGFTQNESHIVLHEIKSELRALLGRLR